MWSICQQLMMERVEAMMRAATMTRTTPRTTTFRLQVWHTHVHTLSRSLPHCLTLSLSVCIGKTEIAATMRAVAQDAKANDSRDRVAAADRADMAARAAASRGRAIVAICIGSSCVCGKRPCVGGVNMEHYQNNDQRCKTCECCLIHRIFDPEKGKRKWDPKIKGGCCARAPMPCPHNDPKLKENAARLGNDDAFMDRDINEEKFDDFAEPMSGSSEEDGAENEPAYRARGQVRGVSSRVSSRRQQYEAQYRQKVSLVRQEM